MMFGKRILKRLYALNVPQSLMIISILTLALVIFFVKHPFDYNFAKSLAHFAIIYFSAAFLLYVFLYGISHFPKGRTRKTLVMFTRIYIRFHIAIAIIGTLMIIFHASLMLTIIPINSPYALTGLLTLLGLLGVLITGYLRKRRSSGKRRRYHRYMAFLFIILVIIHLVI
jgi:DMSO/TMAO reductase YedYZ heme-binding membrane subunit